MTSTKKIRYHGLKETINEYKWTLYNFLSFNEPTGKFINSEAFLSNGIKWYIQLFPNGDVQDSKGYISIFLCILKEGAGYIKVTVDSEFTISNDTMICVIIKVENITYNPGKGPHRWGLSKFLPRTVLNDLKDKNDILTVTVKIIFLNTAQSETKYLNVLQDFGSLLETEEMNDVILVSSDKTEHKAHKAILACRSKVFSAMFQHNMKERQDNTVKIEDVDNETLKEMLRFVYTGKIVTDKEDLYIKLLIAADKYELNDLRRMCINYLIAIMNSENVLDLIKIADTYNIREMGFKAKEYFIQKRKKILSVEKRKKLKQLP